MTTSRRLAAGCGALLAAAALTGIPAAPAAANPTSIYGVLALRPTSGTATNNPMFAQAAASKPCPPGFGTNAALRVGKLGGPYGLLTRIGSEMAYDKVNPVLKPNRAMAAATAGAPADGGYVVTLECFSELGPVSSKIFATAITVKGGQWKVTGTPASLPNQPSGGPVGDGPAATKPVMTLPPKASGKAAGGTATGVPPAGATTPPPGPGHTSAPKAAPAANIDPDDGSNSWWWVVGGVAVGGAGAVALLLMRRRRVTAAG